MKTNMLGGVALLVAIVSLGLNGYLLYDRNQTQDEQLETNIATAFDAMMDSYCASDVRASEEEMVALAKDVTGVQEAKVITEDGVRKLEVGYDSKVNSGWATLVQRLDCEISEVIE